MIYARPDGYKCCGGSPKAFLESLYYFRAHSLSHTDIVAPQATTADLEHHMHLNFHGVFFAYTHAASQLIVQGDEGRLIGMKFSCITALSNAVILPAATLPLPRRGDRRILQHTGLLRLQSVV